MIIAISGHYYHPDFLDKLALPVEDGKLVVRKIVGAEPPPPPSNLIIVTIDEPSINQYGRWPWPRNLLGDLVNQLNQASVIGFDIIFSEKAGTNEDNRFAQSLKSANNTILGFFFRGKASETIAPESQDLLENCSYPMVDQQSDLINLANYPYAEINIAQLAEAANSCGNVNITPDTDGLYRHYPLGLLHNGYLYPPLAIQSLQYHWNKSAEITLAKNGIKHFTLGQRELSNTNNLRFNFYGDQPSPFETISASAVLAKKYPKNYFNNKLVLLGITEIGIFDVRPTPLNVVTPGIYLHATALANLLDGQILNDSKFIDLLLIIVSLLAISFINMLPAIWQRYTGYLAILILTVVASCFLLINQLIWVREFYALAGILLLATVMEIASYKTSERKANEIKKAFSSYVSPELINEISKNPDSLQLGGEARQITTLFSDIRGFTGISEKYQPFQIVQLLNEIHGPLTEIILRHQGMLDKYIGDAMMVLYNAPVMIDNHADKAVASAMNIIEEMEKINQGLIEQQLPSVEIGIGINTGECVVGNMGSKKRFAYTAIGDSVNLAARLEGLCKTYKVPLIISGQTKNGLQQEWLMRKLDLVQVSGKKKPVEIFQILPKTEANVTLAREFSDAQKKYFAREFTAANKIFRGLEEKGDKVSGVFSDRCMIYLKQPPPADWSGIFIAESK